MSHNNKNRRQIAAARARKGQKGPASTVKKNTKRKTWFAIKDGKINAPSRRVEQEPEAE